MRGVLLQSNLGLLFLLRLFAGYVRGESQSDCLVKQIKMSVYDSGECDIMRNVQYKQSLARQFLPI